MLVAACVLLVCISFGKANDVWLSHWQNTFDDPLCVSCWPSETGVKTILSAITGVESRFHTWYVDRQYRINCSNFVDTPTELDDCFETTQVYYEKDFKVHCGYDYMMTGFIGYHNDWYEDRKWTFQCCRAKGYCLRACEWSTKSSFRGKFDINAPAGKFLNGVKGDWHGGEK